MIITSRVWRPSLRSNGSRAFASLTAFAVKLHGAILETDREEPNDNIRKYTSSFQDQLNKSPRPSHTLESGIAGAEMRETERSFIPESV